MFNEECSMSNGQRLVDSAQYTNCMAGEQEGEGFSDGAEKLKRHGEGTLPRTGNNGRLSEEHSGTPPATQ
jgi:hypothetical protein